jgi:hypothetical protein
MAAAEPSADEDPRPSHDLLPSTMLIPNSSLLRRLLSRLPKLVIIDLVLIWLENPLCPIHEADDEENYFMPSDETLEERRALYVDSRDKGVTKKSVIDRILGNDWVAMPHYS